MLLHLLHLHRSVDTGTSLQTCMQPPECSPELSWACWVLVAQMETVPYLIDNPEVGYVQARWTFKNPDESYLTKAQEISLNFHCKCEQFVHFASGSFFNFNGTAGRGPSCCPVNLFCTEAVRGSSWPCMGS